MTTDELLEVLLEICEPRAASGGAGQVAAAALTLAVIFHLRNEGLLSQNEETAIDQVQRLTQHTVAEWPKKEELMLVLSRHRDEEIFIGDDIVITVLDICGDKVRLGIAAPVEVPVHRREVADRLERERRERDGA